MEKSNGDLPIQRDAILSELCCEHVTGTHLVEVQRSLVALTDPQEGELTQSQEKALNSLGIWQTVFAAAPGPAPKAPAK